MIHIITTGGTIEGLEYDDEQKKPENNEVSIKGFLKAANISSEYTVHPVFSKDSRFITKKDRGVIAEKINSVEGSKILITHGTLTMVETAHYLGNLDLARTVVLVGSFILGSEKNSDAAFNLGYAIAALRYLDNGVYIAMNGRTFSWDNVIKNSDKNRFEENAG